jgi:hypothetical protein
MVMEFALLVWAVNVFIFFIGSLIGGFHAAFTLILYMWAIVVGIFLYFSLSDFLRKSSKWRTKYSTLKTHIREIAHFSSFALAFPIAALTQAILIKMSRTTPQNSVDSTHR